MSGTQQKATQLYDLIDGIEIAMFTTRRPDGRLVSRPMATQARAAGADLWFVTDASAYKLDELEQEPHVNLAYYNQKSREYVSVSGTGRISNDRAKIAELYRPDWKAWFDGDSKEAGTPDDPRIVLIAVDVESAVYLKVDKPRPVVLYEVVKGMLTGSTPDLGETQRVSGRELH
ncbi:MAG TPA: pyridoxamine 5'-phosphate oxidase family protein [Gammaproteobacteria bacterium]|nr:pyridoxamine 5'-phosphate oxidase family protein [Gammaproteobacteria bacterium]